MTRSHDPAEVVTAWLSELEEAKKREQEFRTQGQRILDLYAGDTTTHQTPFNILYSNTETLLPALYSMTPRPVVQRRFKDDDPLGKAAATAAQRLLEFLLDTNLEGYDPFDFSLRRATLDALLPGRAFTSVIYHADLPEVDAESATPGLRVAETVCLETRVWNRVLCGYATRWSAVPWIAYEDYIDQEEAARLFGAETAARMRFTTDQGDPRHEDALSPAERHLGSRKTACIYQIWDKAGGKKLRYISQHFPDGYLKEEDDPLGLTGFFNCPMPLQFVEKAHTLLPTAPYRLYENQARELNRLTVRINKIVEAIKARGAYDGQLGGDLGNIMKLDDNELVPTDSASTLSVEKGLGNAIWFMPVEQLMTVLTQLYAAREQCKRVIYEITGIADIIRGSSVASETLGAQQIKERWGTMRLKRLQKEVQRYTKDLLRMMVELAATKFSEETWAAMTGLPFVTSLDRQQLDAIAQAAAMTGQPLDPQTSARLAAPVWGHVLALLRDDLHRAYRIDIETNSTIEPDATEDQKQIADLMNALGQYLNGVGPLVKEGVLPFQTAQSMLLAITRRFRFGTEVEDSIKQMQAPKPETQDADRQADRLAGEQQRVKDQATIAQLQTALAHQEHEAAMQKERAALEVQALTVRAAEDKLKLEQQVAQHTLACQEHASTATRGADEKVRAMKEAAAKHTMSSAQASEGKLASSVQVIQGMAQTVAAVQQGLTDVHQATTQTHRLLEAVLATLQAPRRKRAIRGADGRIESVEDSPIPAS